MKAVAGLVFYGKSAVESVVDDMHSGKGKLSTNLMGDTGVNRDL